MPNITANRIVWDSDDWFAGLHQQSGTSGNILFSGAYSQIAFNPFRFLGYASPGKNGADATNVSVVDGILKRIVYTDSTQTGYAVGGTKVHEINSTTSALTSGAVYPHAVATSTMEDGIIYNVAGVDYFYYSYNVGGAGEIGRVDIIASPDTFTDAYWTTTLSAAAMGNNPHPMIVGDDDVLYIGDGNVLKSINSTTPNTNSLTLPRKYMIRSFAKLSDRTLVIFASTNNTTTTKTGQVKAFFWDYVKRDPYKVCDVFGSKAGGAFEYNGTIGIFTIGLSLDEEKNRNVHMSLFDGNSFKINRSIISSSEPGHGGIEVFEGQILANVGGNVYSFGSPYSGVSVGVTQIIKGSGTTQGGAIKTLFSRNILLSSGVTTTGGLQIFASGYNGDSQIITSAAEANFNNNYVGKIKSVRIEFYTTVTGGRSVSVQLLAINSLNDIGQVISAVETITSSNLKTIIYNKTDGTPFEFFTGLHLNIEWGAGSGSTVSPVIRRIIVEYEPIEIT